MQQQATGSGLCPFSLLSLELIQQVLSPLDLRTRVRCMLVSRRFRQAGNLNGLLWRNVACSPRSPQQMRGAMEWVYLRHHHIRRLSLRPEDNLDPHALLPLWGTLVAACILPAATLISLDLTFPGEVELGGWIIPLAQLRWLSVAAPRLVVTSDVGRLRRLRTLQLGALNAEHATEDSIVFHSACIPVQSPSVDDTVCYAASPAGLRTLVLDDMWLGELPPALALAGASLTRLSLRCNYCDRFAAEGRSGGLALLPALTRLCVLELQHCDWESTQGPRELGVLTALTHLSLSWSFQSHPPTSMQNLSPLHRLQYLDLQYCQLTVFDVSRHGLRALRTLCVSGNPELVLLEDLDWMTHVEQLDLDLGAAVENRAAFGKMSNLRQLCLNGYDTLPVAPPSAESMAELLRSLAHIPRLHTLFMKNGIQKQLTSSDLGMAALGELLRQRPRIELRNSYRPVGNPFSHDGWLTWEKVQEEEEELG